MKSQTQRPNIILLTIDTLRADLLGCYGRRPSPTPSIDGLAAQALRFEQAITGGSWTQAAFPTIFTSTYASMYGGCLDALSAERPSPVERLTESGYRSAGFSSAPWISRLYGYQRGFEQFVDLEPGDHDPWLRRVRGGQLLLRSTMMHRMAALFGKKLRPARLYVSADEVNRAAFDWLAGVTQPFFLWMHYMDVHWPYHVDDELNDANVIASAWQDLADMHTYYHEENSLPVDVAARFRCLYEEALKYTDAAVGRLLKCLTSADLADNTILILVSDHGEEFLERGRWGHVETNLHDEIVKVPLIIRAPDVSGRSIAQQVSTLDIMPTVMELCGCVPPSEMLGMSLAPLLENANRSLNFRRHAVCERWRDDAHIIAVRSRDFKYVWNANETVDNKLYDLSKDPDEQIDVSSEYVSEVEASEEIVRRVLELGRETATTSAPAVEVSDELAARLQALGYMD